jgi:hypothetical protein
VGFGNQRDRHASAAFASYDQMVELESNAAAGSDIFHGAGIA